MNTSRQNILGAIKSKKINSLSPDEIQKLENELLDDLGLIQPTIAQGSPVDNFVAKINSQQVVASHDIIKACADLPMAVARYVTQHQLSKELFIQPIAELTGLHWGGLKVHEYSGCAQQREVSLAITKGLCGAAETGSILIRSAPDHPVLLNFIPDHHILLIDANNIVTHLDEVAAEMQRIKAEQRLTCLITGASGTTDIEGVLVNGAHGPKFLHIILIDARSP